MSFETYATLLNKKILVPSQKADYIAVKREFFIACFAQMIGSVFVDADWYLTAYPDVKEAIGKSIVPSAAVHYREFGFFEHRMPYEIIVDEAWYAEHYKDVAEAVRKGVFTSGQEHFQMLGYREGRLPFANFSLREAEATTAQ